MAQTDDIQLVREFATARSEAAFAELVQRHLPLVYSTALRRTGNPHAAEEIAQAVFLTLARKAASLPPRTVVSGWLYHTARLTAANYLRGEARRQQREQEAYMNSLSDGAEAAVWPQIAPLLDDAMAALGEADRNAVVLRYFENKPLEEVGLALGTTADAARMRVNRALEKLRHLFARRGVTPGTALLAGVLSAHCVHAAPAGLAAAISKTAAVAAVSAGGVGIGAKALSSLTKSPLFSWSLPFFALLSSLPGMLFAAFVSRMERRNFRDQDGFRARLHWLGFRSFLWGFPLVWLVILFLSHRANTAWGTAAGTGAVTAFIMVLTLISARSLVICRHPFQIGMFVYCGVIATGLGAHALGWLPAGLRQLPMVLATVVLLAVLPRRPARMDYNLFLRAAQGLLHLPPESDQAVGAPPLGRGALLAFARFLGGRFLATNYRWSDAGLALRLPPLRSQFLRNVTEVFSPPVSRRCSSVVLGWDGCATARFGERDAADLAAVEPRAALDGSSLEQTVSVALTHAWRQYRCGDLAAAEQTLGQLPESSVFLVSPAKAKSTWWLRLGLGAIVVIMLVGLVLQYRQPPALSGLHPVAVTEAQVRVFLNAPAARPDPAKFEPNNPALALFTCLVLPPTNLFDAQALRRMQEEVAGQGGFSAIRTQASRGQWAFTTPLARRALTEGWLAWSDLGFAPEALPAYFRTNLPSSVPPEHWDHLLTRCRAWSWVQNESFETLRIQSDGLAQLRQLQSVGCLDFVNREELIRQIASVQVLSGNPPGQPPIHDWRDVRGLFYTPCFPTLQDTYIALAALEILGGLDRIDRAQCARGILQQHRGQGYFTSPSSGGFNEYHIMGDAPDTFAAYESLRILGALDRVKDLAQWQFRPQRRGLAKDQLTWQDVMAWTCQQRLARIVRDHQAHPEAPFRSLREE